MMTTLFVVVGILVAAVAVRWAMVYFRAGGSRVITCPESKTSEVVSLDRGEAAATALVGRPHLQLADCTRWPEREGCDEACLQQIGTSLDGCLLGRTVREWYEGKACVFCANAFHEIQWHDHKPGLRSPDGQLFEWADLRPVEVFDALETHAPVCWNCLMTETFRARFPERVIDVPSHDARRAR